MSYKYLGLEVEKDWKWKQTKARMLEKGIRRQGLSVKAAVRAWEALVLPIFEYAREIWRKMERSR